MCTDSSGAQHLLPTDGTSAGPGPPVLVRQKMAVKAKLLMAIAFVMSWGLSINIPIRW
jgi:hypothetical protein